MEVLHLLQVPHQLIPPKEELEVKLAPIKGFHSAILFGERREVPCLHGIPTKLDLAHVFHLCHLLVIDQVVLIKRFVTFPLLFAMILVSPLLRLGVVRVKRLGRDHSVKVELFQVDPRVHTPIEPPVVHVILVLQFIASLGHPNVDDPRRVHLLPTPQGVHQSPRLERQNHFRARHRCALHLGIMLGTACPIGGVGLRHVLLPFAPFHSTLSLRLLVSV
mmetsp:Transcript_15594/g.44387  ORF Transcript_15594/g.44387 Transcript_15594/m.44387 type:complete len:219 (-) Transcript_15594:2496-3152(-)